ncbi:hypothetical protein G7Y29_10580 [Corynebacterium qintianiae]|uniref:Uncharacterized protein n=1 Tax=Corynebacterium qintianiae TaxID=2709392 RepID=A0A7T0PFR0_9CORY|nr:hypothetical protein [Corynebacterium qintianiae]QPK83247.1 hypothetical protein G7Y29_10580 [Corynebacterium qintianiae]
MKHYVRIHYAEPDLGGELLNIAELEDVTEVECTMLRMIELDPAETITGIYAEGRVVGRANTPMGTVPHPDSYGQFDGITATRISRDEFEGLWQEALHKLGLPGA